MGDYINTARRRKAQYFGRKMPPKPFYVFFFLKCPLSGKYDIIYTSSLENARSEARKKVYASFVAEVKPAVEGAKDVKAFGWKQIK